MKRNSIASLILVSGILTGTLFAGEVGAKNLAASNNPSVGGSVLETAFTAANNSSTSSGQCCSGRATVTFENYTPWRIDCYLDGTFVGYVYPGGTLTSWARIGWTRPFARAVFVNGSSLEWNPGDVFYLPGGRYAFPMTQ